MLMNDYQKKAMRTARSADAKDEVFHLLLGLSGEVGEVMEKAKKVVRDNDSHFDDNFRRELYKELGDVLWYIAVLCDYFDTDLASVAELNIRKLQDRKDRGVLGGSGDDR